MRKLIMVSMMVSLLLVGVASAALARGPSDHYRTTVYDITEFPRLVPIAGSSASLVTTNRGARLQVNTSGLPAGHAVTVWWVIFNYPENCSDGVCGPDDAFPPPGNLEAGASVSLAAGHVIGRNGNGNFGGHISVGGDATPWPVGLLHPRTAEYHFVLRDHGPMTPGIVDGQISTGHIGCNNIGPGTGEYTCVDFQAGAFGD